MPSFLKIGMPVPEKIFEGILPYMGVAAILSCDPDATKTFSSHLSKEASHTIWL